MLFKKTKKIIDLAEDEIKEIIESVADIMIDKNLTEVSIAGFTIQRESNIWDSKKFSNMEKLQPKKED